MSIIPEIPGCIFAGYTEHPDINDGKPFPLFEPIMPKDRPSINTLDGWNAMVNAQNLRYFRRRYGRDPHNDEELQRYANALVDPQNATLPFDAIGIPGVE